MKKRQGFSLIELMVVIAIVALLSALLYPAVHKAILRARLMIAAQFKLRPLCRSIFIMHILASIAVVDVYLAQLPVQMLYTSSLQLSFNSATVSFQNGGDVPWGDPPTGHPLNNHVFLSGQVLALPATFLLFHVVSFLL